MKTTLKTDFEDLAGLNGTSYRINIQKIEHSFQYP